jgi:hypothetical protein
VQGVHQVWNMHSAGAWKEGATKMNKFVLIGKDIDQAEVNEQFEACIDGTPQNAECPFFVFVFLYD